jgi:hypothetical protein
MFLPDLPTGDRRYESFEWWRLTLFWSSICYIVFVFAARPLARARKATLPKRLEALRRAGICPDCGYDLRASPYRCPECGKQPDYS